LHYPLFHQLEKNPFCKHLLIFEKKGGVRFRFSMPTINRHSDVCNTAQNVSINDSYFEKKGGLNPAQNVSINDSHFKKKGGILFPFHSPYNKNTEQNSLPPKPKPFQSLTLSKKQVLLPFRSVYD
jgi:hypothetical protein